MYIEEIKQIVKLHQTHNKHRNIYLLGFVVKKKYYSQN